MHRQTRISWRPSPEDCCWIQKTFHFLTCWTVENVPIRWAGWDGCWCFKRPELKVH